MTLRRLQPLFSLLILGILILHCGNSLAQTPYVLKGLVMDESDNLLANIKVMLEPHGIETLCDPNGNFTLEVNPSHPANSNTTYTLKAEEVGYQDTSVTITSQQLATGLNEIVLKLTTNPIGGEVIGFAVDMSTEGVDSSEATTAWFHVFIPDAVDSVRAAFYVSRHGIGDITRDDIQQFAVEEEIALVAFYGTPVQRGISPVSKVDKYIDSLAVLSGHPELPDVPIMTFGHSNGTGFASSWPRDRPEQCLAWVSYHPGFTDYLQYENTELVPSMVMVGSVDGYYNPAYDPTDGRRGNRQDNVVYNMRKTRNAAMNVMVEGGVGHHPNDANATWAFIYEFLKSAMRVRLSDHGKLKDIDIESGWLGSHYDLKTGGRQQLDIASYANYKYEKSSANWLPDKEFAKHWQCYGATAKLCEDISDTFYKLKIKICDTESTQVLTNVTIYINDTTYTTNEGAISLNLPEGYYQYTLNKTGYQSIHQSINLTKDTTATQYLVKKKYELTFKVDDAHTGAYLKNISININDTIFFTNSLGMCDVTLNYGTHSYTLSKYGYTTYTDQIVILNDTTITVKMNTWPNGVKQPVSIKLRTYPNPVENTLTIDTDSHNELDYTLYNIVGELILSGKINPNKTTLNVSRLDPCIYYIKIADNNSFTSKKIIKK